MPSCTSITNSLRDHVMNDAHQRAASLLELFQAVRRDSQQLRGSQDPDSGGIGRSLHGTGQPDEVVGTQGHAFAGRPTLLKPPLKHHEEHLSVGLTGAKQILTRREGN